MRIRTLAFFAGAVALTGLAVQVRPAAAQQEYDVGVVGAMTGVFAPGTKDTLDGFNIWLKDHGPTDKKIVLKIEDDETNPVNAQNVFRLLANDKSVNVIMMFSNSNAGMAIKPFASEFKVPIISGGGSDTLGIPPDPYLFKVAPTTLDNMRALGNYIKFKGYKKIAHIHGTDDFGQLESRNLNQVAKEDNFSLVDQEAVAIDATNFNTEITKLLASKPDLIYSSLASRTMIIFYKEWLQLKPPVPLAVTGASISQPLFDAIGGAQNAKGLIGITQIGTLGTKVGGATATYYAEVQKALGKTPAYFNTFGFDAGLILGQALANSDGSREGMRVALEKIKDLPAINGFVTFTAQSHTGQDQRGMTVGIQDGTGGYDPALPPS